VRKALRFYSSSFIALIVLVAVGLGTLFVILSQQASALPSWFPILGEDRLELKAELETAQAVTPGQGQAVNMSGVKVGDITAVELEDGVAVVTMAVDPEYASLIHPDASALLRPRTGLQDMTLEVDPGRAEGSIEEGHTIPLANTAPNVNLDQILASLDGDTRAYLRLLLAGGAQALEGERSEQLSATLRRLEPTSRDLAAINGAIAERRANLRRVITNFKLLAERVGADDVQLAEFIDSQATVFGAFAESEASIRESLQNLPGALEETRGALDASEELSRELAPALDRLLPSARAFGPAMRATQPFFEQTTGPIRDQIRPFTREVDDSVTALRRAAGPLEESSTGLDAGLTELNQLLNALTYNPPGADEGYLFYASWLNHNTNNLFLTQDSGGPLRRGLVMYTCLISTVADNVVATRPFLRTVRAITRVPTTDEIC
jgi:phospholipid/cholesterol/gamma-HCH transport system substrate-binding protein